MKSFCVLMLAGITAMQSCNQLAAQQEAALATAAGSATISRWIYPEGSSLQQRILPPTGYERAAALPLSFAHYLRQLALKPHGSPVLYHHGAIKERPGVYAAVLDMDIGKKDLQQCADAVIRLRAEYLWQQKRYDQIHFNLTNGFRVDYSEWMKGKRVAVEGNKTWWKQSASPENTYESFRRYLDFVFAYAGTLSLARELGQIEVKELQVGDVFVQGGSPGHAVIVVDKAAHPLTGKVIFLLAQSYMPAQDIQILQNHVDKSLSPWYAADFGETLYTPEWTFKAGDLKRFGE